VLTITIPGDELWDEENQVFTYTDPIVLEFEHSLVSLSKWEAKFHKLFLTQDKKTEEEMVGYLKAMLMTPDVPDEVLNRMTEENILAIDAYINDPMTGSTISELPQRGPRSSERLSSELIYFWMSQFGIDTSAEDWHLNRLFTLIKIHHAKSQKQQKQPRQKTVQTMAEINAARKAKLGTKG
jgi:SOS response regulatory protein OraA/RecX